MTAPDHQDRWHFDDRWYLITAFSEVGSRDRFGLELEDVAPSPGKGVVLSAFYDDSTSRISISSKTADPLPLDLVEQFLEEVRIRTMPRSGL